MGSGFKQWIVFSYGDICWYWWDQHDMLRLNSPWCPHKKWSKKWWPKRPFFGADITPYLLILHQEILVSWLFYSCGWWNVWATSYNIYIYIIYIYTYIILGYHHEKNANSWETVRKKLSGLKQLSKTPPPNSLAAAPPPVIKAANVKLPVLQYIWTKNIKQYSEDSEDQMGISWSWNVHDHISSPLIPRLGQLQPVNPEDQRVRVPFVCDGRQAWEPGAVLFNMGPPQAMFVGL